MFDKNEQRRRAAELTATLLKQGQQVPSLPLPKIEPAPVAKKVRAPRKSAETPCVDMLGNSIQVGDTVAYTHYYTGSIFTGEVLRISKSKKSVYVKWRRDGGWRRCCRVMKIS